MDNNNRMLAALQAENSQLRDRLKCLETGLAQAQTMAQKEIDKNAALRSQMSQMCSMNDHLRAENARLIQQQVNNVSSSSSTSADGIALNSSANPFVSPTLVPQFEASTFWQAMVGISNSSSNNNNPSSTNHSSNNNNYPTSQRQRHGHQQQQQQQGIIDSVTATPLSETADDDSSKLVASSQKMKRELRYHCDWPGCAYATAYGGDLNKHRRKHTGERPYQCDQCHAAFGQHSSLSAHKYTHSDLKRFNCPQCEYSTNKSSDWTKHLKTGKHKKSL